MNRRRVAMSAMSVLAIGALVLFVPLRHWVRCSFHIQPRDAANVYVAVPGSLQKVLVRPGNKVAAGQTIASLENIDFRLAIARIEGERACLNSKLDGLRQRAFNDESALEEITHVKEAIAGLDKQLQRRRRDIKKLSIVAPVSGTLLPAPSVSANNKNDHQLAFSGCR